MIREECSSDLIQAFSSSITHNTHAPSPPAGQTGPKPRPQKCTVLEGQKSREEYRKFQDHPHWAACQAALERAPRSVSQLANDKDWIIQFGRKKTHQTHTPVNPVWYSFRCTLWDEKLNNTDAPQLFSISRPSKLHVQEHPL